MTTITEAMFEAAAEATGCPSSGKLGPRNREFFAQIYLAMLAASPTNKEPSEADVERVGAQVDEVLANATVKAPSGFMPDYWQISIKNPPLKVVQAIRDEGLCVLPICIGPRSGFPIYEGEITEKGRSRRDAAITAMQREG